MSLGTQFPPNSLHAAWHVGGGVKVVGKWRFEIPKESWHGFRLDRPFAGVSRRLQAVLGALTKEAKKEEGVQ
jgi:hypothetical protein